ncbi:MAG TPA: acyltransferase, partial [Tepidisphaeraceae bacterium]|nr:acyltransferase [Tepidisphaeraceae bacterium]
LAISLVLIGHCLPTAFEATGWQTVPATVFGNGHLGVEIFFVISGFLITRLLMQERERYGNISLSQFYLRRTFRILPAFYCFMLFILIAWLAGRYAMRGADILFAAVFLRNYDFGASSWVVGHTWSLSVEEQFYLMWPLLLVLLGNRKAAKVAVALLALSPLVRVANYHLFPSVRGYIPIMLHTRIDALMFGCATALFYDHERFNRTYQWLCARRIPIIAVVFLFFVSPLIQMRLRGLYLLPIGYTIEGVCITLMMVWLIRNAQSPIGRIFNAAPVRHIGVLSYSLYLWQQPFFDHEQHWAITRFPLNIAYVMIVAHASYYLVERPFLALRQRLEKPRSTPAEIAKEAAVTEAMPAI